MNNQGSPHKEAVLALLVKGHQPAEISRILGITREIVCGIRFRHMDGHVPRKPKAKANRPMEQVSHFKTCQYIEGEPRQHQMCGQKSVPGFSYCLDHVRVCYLTREQREAMPI